MSETIILSSSDEESPPSKKLKSILMGNLLGITITPISKENKSKSVCLISDDEENDSEPEVQEILDDETLTKTHSVTCDEEINNKNIEDPENKDCEIVSVTNSNIIDITRSEYVESQAVNGNQDLIEIMPDDKTSETNEDFADKELNIVSVKSSEQIIDITEHNEETNEGSLMEVHEQLNDTNITTATTLENNESSPAAEKTDDLLIAKSETAVPSIDVLDEESKLSSSTLIENFLEICKNMLENTEYQLGKQFELLKQYYKKCEPELIKCEDFKKFIESNIKKANGSPHQVVISFGEVFKHVKDLAEFNAVEVSKKTKIRLQRLEFAIKLLVTKIKELENEEVDFDEEEDSSYLKLERYITRLNKLYLKYCQYLKSNPHAGRITYTKLNFVDSKYNEINRAISKKYRNNRIFPSYYEMQNFIKNVLTQNNLELSDAEIKTESQHCFKKLGELLQTRRKRELHDTHNMYIHDSSDDPASKDPNLQSILESNFRKAQSDIEKLCNEYVTKQDQVEKVNMNDDNNESDSSETENEGET